MNKDDLRFKKTDKAIRKAFMECVEEGGFTKTRVSDLCQRAQVSRNTFYDHYVDKYDLVDRQFWQFENHCRQTYTVELRNRLLEDDVRPAVSWYIGLIQEDRELAVLLMECVPDRFMELLKRAVIIEPLQELAGSSGASDLDFSCQLNIDYMFYGMLGFTKTWLQEPDAISIDDAIDELEALCRIPVRLCLEKLGTVSRDEADSHRSERRPTRPNALPVP